MKITELKTSTFWKGELGLQADVEDGGSHYKVRLYIKGSQIRDYSCSCVNGNSFRGMCVHGKLVWDAWQRQQQEGMGKPVITSQEIRTMIREYTNREVAEIIQEREEKGIRLVPRLILQKEAVLVEFKLGRERMYLLKDLAAFAEALETGAAVAYGKQLSFHHSIYAFAEEDRPLCSFLQELVHVYRDHYRQFSRSAYVTVQGLRRLNLSRANRERFLGLMEGRTMDVELSAGETVTVTVGGEDPAFRIPVDICRAGRDGIELSVDPELYGFAGENRWYAGNRERLVCFDPETSRRLGGFLEQALKDRRSRKMTIQDRDIPLFYERVLPKILPSCQLTVKDVDLEQYRPQELKAVFSFDSSRPGEITMRPELSYGDFSFSPVEDETVPRTICRDVPGEFRISQVISRYFRYRDETGETLMIQDDEDALYHLLHEGIEEFMSLGTVRMSEAAGEIRILPPPRVQVGVQAAGRWLELTVEADGMTQAQLQRILSEYEPKKPYYRLKTGEFLQLDENGLVTAARLADELAVSRGKLAEGKLKLPLYRAFYLDSALKGGSGITFYRDSFFKAMIRGMKAVEDSDFEIPASMAEVLRGYQKTGFRWMRTLDSYGFGGILADDMGLGKTIQVIALILDEAKKSPEERFLIICPASLVYNWENEFRRFAPELGICTVTGTAKEREELLSRPEREREAALPAGKAAGMAQDKSPACAAPRVFITSYDLLKRDLALYEHMEFRFQIIDEAQYIKNPATQAARAVRQVRSRTRFALTGTPVENRLSELWSIFEFLMPGFLFPYGTFKKKLEQPVVKDGDSKALTALKRLTAPFILRRLKRDVLKELPEKLEMVMYSGMDGEQKQLYTAQACMLKQYLEQAEGSLDGQERIQILSQLTRLRQICCDPALCFENYRGGSAKLETCMELIRAGIRGGHKLLLFSQFASMLEQIKKRLKKEEISCYMLTGATPKEERIHMAGAFQTDDVPVFLISLKAGGTGLNLTAADIVIHYDPWWNAAAQNQATDRTHRIGQEKQVTVYQLIMRNSVEENILKLQEKKRTLAEQIMEGGASSMPPLTREELLRILS
ncbi:MAG: DEAD/DEAH box helicase [Eubacteriales bacterium]|nr:DEAD/DEAH box helicase [Eubacteriales bacterium]